MGNRCGARCNKTRYLLEEIQFADGLRSSCVRLQNTQRYNTSFHFTLVPCSYSRLQCILNSAVISNDTMQLLDI